MLQGVSQCGHSWLSENECCLKEVSDHRVHMERKWSTKERGTVVECYPVCVRVWECVGAGGYTMPLPLLT